VRTEHRGHSTFNSAVDPIRALGGGKRGIISMAASRSMAMRLKRSDSNFGSGQVLALIP